MQGLLGVFITGFDRRNIVKWYIAYWTWLLDNSRIPQLADCQLADWTTRGLDISRTGQLADAICDFACLVVLLAASRDRELSSPRLVQFASWQSASWRIRELSSYLEHSHCRWLWMTFSVISGILCLKVWYLSTILLSYPQTRNISVVSLFVTQKTL